MRIQRLSIKNLGVLNAVDVDLSQSDVISVCGKNGSGKTTVLDAIKLILGGAKTVSLDMPIREGETKAEVIAVIDKIRIEREFVGRPGGKYSTSIKAYDEGTGYEIPSPQSTLERLLGKAGALMLNPIAFAELGPTVQVEALKKLLDLDFSDLDVQAETLKNELTYTEKALAELKAKNAGNPSTEGAPDSPVDVSALATELSEIESAQQRIDAGEQHLRLKQNLVQSTKDQIAELQAKLAEQEKEAADYAKRLDDERKKVAALRSAETVRSELSTAQAQNDLYNLAVRLEGDRKAFKEKEARRVEIEKAMDAIKAERKKRVAAKEMPIASLEFGDSGLLYKGKPFSQASKAETIEVGTAIAMAQANGQIKVVLVEDASLLDDDHLAIVRELAAKQGAQLFLEIVRPEFGEGTVLVLEQGEVISTKEAASA